MAAPSKTDAVTLFALASVASNTVSIGSVIAVPTKISAKVGIHIGRRTNSALTTVPTIRIEYSTAASGDGYWFPLYQTAPGVLTLAESELVSGTVGSGTNVITVASTTNLVVGSLVYIDHTTIANSEFGRVKAISAGVSITLEDNLRNAQTGSTIYTQALILPAQLDLKDVTRIRVVVDASATGQAIAVEITAVYFDSFA